MSGKQLLFLFDNLLLLLISFSVFPQAKFQETTGDAQGDYAWSVRQTTDGGYILSGTKCCYDIPFVKTDAGGVVQWHKTLGGASTEEGMRVLQTTDGGYVVCGYTISFGAGSQDACLIKTDGSGTVQWAKTYGGSSGEQGLGISQTTDGGFIVTGLTQSYGAGGIDAYLFRTDMNGNLQWANSYGGGNTDFTWNVAQTPDGGYITCGLTYSFGSGGQDFYVIKTDGDGTLQWSKAYGGNNDDYGGSLETLSSGGYVFGATTKSYGAGNADDMIIRTDADGNTLWSKTLGGNSVDGTVYMQQTTDGGFFVLTYMQSFGFGGTDFSLAKIDSTGDLKWAKAYGGVGEDVPSWSAPMHMTSDGGVIMSGWTESFGAGSDDIYLIKTDPDGESGCNEMSINPVIQSITPIVTLAGTSVSSGGTELSFVPIETIPSLTDSLICADPGPVAGFTADSTVICAGDCVDFTDLSGGTPDTWEWSFPGGSPSSSTVQNPQNICYALSGTYDVTLIVTNSDGTDTLTKTGYILVNPCLPPATGFAVNDTLICAGDCVDFTDQSTNNPVSWEWTFAGGMPSTSALKNPQDICYPAPGTYDVTLIATNIYGSDTLIKTSYVVAYIPTVDAGADVTITKGSSTALNATGGTIYQWTPAEGLSDTSIANPVANPDTTTMYYVTITDANGCTNTDSVKVMVVEKGDIFIPTVFTPNGDGINEEFMAKGIGINTFMMSIYNRWGEKLYSSEDITKGWSGKDKAEGVYVYRVNGTFKDGTTYARAGTFLLLR